MTSSESRAQEGVSPMTITQATETSRDGVFYAVYRGDERAWSVFVPFGKGYNQPAGGAFVEAAQAQVRYAHELAAQSWRFR